MKRIGLAAALSLVAAGVIGDVITIHPAAYYSGFAAAHNARTGKFLSVAAGRDTSSSTYSIRGNLGLGATSTAILSDASPMTDPSIAWSLATNRFLVVYIKADTVTGLVLNGDGTRPAGSTPFSISSGTSGPISPRVASDGTDWTVAWGGWNADWESRVYARRIAGTSTTAAPSMGSIIDVAQPMDQLSHVDVAFAGTTDGLIAWSHESYDYNYPSVDGRTLSATGALGTQQTYTANNDWEESYLSGLTLAGGDGCYLLGWGDYGQKSGNTALRTQLVGGDGGPLGPSALIHDPPYVNQGFRGGGAPFVLRESFRLAWSPLAGEFLAAWSEQPVGSSNYGVLAALLGADGTTVVEDNIELNPPQYVSYSTAQSLSVAVARITSSRALVQWPNANTSPAIVGRLYDTAGLEAPPPPGDAEQVKLDGTTVIVQGATTNESSFIVTALPSGNEQKVRLEVEVAVVGTAFRGTATALSAYVASGAKIALPVDLPDLALGRAYHWQSRFAVEDGLASFWVEHGNAADPTEIDLKVRSTNATPSLSGIDQLRGSNGAPIAPGLRINGETTVLLHGSTGDADNDDVRFEVELQPVRAGYAGIPTSTGPWVKGGASSDLLLPIPAFESGGAWHWQARAVDRLGGATAWIAFGGNAEDAADFDLDAFGSTAATSCFHSAGTGASLLLPALILFLRRREIRC